MNMQMKCEVKALLILNRRARSGGNFPLDECIARLEQGGLRLTVFDDLEKDDSFSKLYKLARASNLVIVAGGDGTVHHCLGLLMKVQKPLAVLPAGTANDLVRSLMIPADPLEACDVILQGVQMKVDVGKVNERYFLNAAHIGLGVKITNELTAESKKQLGDWSYLRAFFMALKGLRSFRVRLRVDDQELRMRVLHICVGNGRYYGGGNIVDQRCYLGDGKFSLYALRPQSKWNLLGIAPLIRTGIQSLARSAFTAQATDVVVQTRRPMKIYADGEYVGTTPAHFGLLPEALTVICSAECAELTRESAPLVKVMEWLQGESQFLPFVSINK